MTSLKFDVTTYAVALLVAECAYVALELVLARLKKRRKALEKEQSKQ